MKELVITTTAITLTIILLTTFDNSSTFEDAYASLAALQINPNSQTAYIDDANIKFTIRSFSNGEFDSVRVCEGFSCHFETIVLDDIVNFQFIDDSTNPSPLIGTINPASIRYPSNTVGTTQLTIDTQTLPIGTYKFQVKATDEDNNERTATGNLIKASTFNPQPTTSQIHQRLTNLEEDVQGINDILENLESLRGPQGEKGETGPQGPSGPQGQRGPPGQSSSSTNIIDLDDAFIDLEEVYLFLSRIS